MKIIGAASDSNVIVYMSKTEFAQLAGFHSEYYMGKDGVPSPVVGTSLEVSKLFNNATELVHWYKEFKGDLLKNHQRLTKLLEIIDPAKSPTAQ